MKKMPRFLLILTLLASSVSVALPVKAEKVCQVTDPTGTPLNVREQPNGRVINSLRNGREVYIEDTANDSQGRPWVKVGGYYEGKYRVWGWVVREFVSCYER